MRRVAEAALTFPLFVPNPFRRFVAELSHHWEKSISMGVVSTIDFSSTAPSLILT